LANGLNPNSAADDNGSDGDPDHDGSRNMHEFLADTDPGDANSCLRVSLVPVASTRYRFLWRAVAGKRYSLEYASGPDLSFRAFSGPGWPRTAISSEEIYEDDVSTSMPLPDARLYRVRLLP
jgi:hypothetical protein